MPGRDRMPQIATASMTGEQKKAAREFEAGRGYACAGRLR